PVYRFPSRRNGVYQGVARRSGGTPELSRTKRLLLADATIGLGVDRRRERPIGFASPRASGAGSGRELFIGEDRPPPPALTERLGAVGRNPKPAKEILT